MQPKRFITLIVVLLLTLTGLTDSAQAQSRLGRVFNEATATAGEKAVRSEARAATRMETYHGANLGTVNSTQTAGGRWGPSSNNTAAIELANARSRDMARQAERLAESKRIDGLAAQNKRSQFTQVLDEQRQKAQQTITTSRGKTLGLTTSQLDAPKTVTSFSKDKQALVDMARKDKKTGMTSGDMQAYKDLNKDLPDPFPSDRVRGPEAHAGRGHGSKPHGHVGPVNHIPIKGN
jgi:hypothetical protein